MSGVLASRDLASLVSQAAETLRSFASGFEKRDDHDHPLSVFVVADLRRQANDLVAALPATMSDEDRDAELVSAWRRASKMDRDWTDSWSADLDRAWAFIQALER